MLFISFEFLLFFLTVFFTIYLIPKNHFQHLFLLTASYYFYYVSGRAYILLFIFSALINFYIGRKLHTSTSAQSKKIILFAGLTTNLGFLFFFKYAQFSVSILNDIHNLLGYTSELTFLSFALPLGISFYTFEAISYLLDIYFEKITPESSLIHFLLFLSFFPKLIAGPIIRAAEFLPQLKKYILITSQDIKIGFTILIFGLIKKLVIADNLSLVVTTIFNDPLIFKSSIPILTGAFIFGIQIYCDFSGYTDIAIGTARILGFTLPQNFNRPYLSKSPIEFWKRWHMSLSFFVRDYLYYPLYFLFSRISNTTKLGNSTLKIKTGMYFASFTSIFLIGIWHGASFNILLFALYNATIVVTYHFFHDCLKFFGLKTKKKTNKIHNLFSIFLNYYVIMLGFLIFRISDTTTLLYLLKQYVSFNLINSRSDLYFITTLLNNSQNALLAITLFLFVYTLYYFKENIDFKNTLQNLPLKWWTCSITALILIIIIFTPSETNVFIYFKF